MVQRLLSADEIEARMPLWCALAELFLDTEVQAQGYHEIARAARDGGFSAHDVRKILEQEVFPAFIFNLMDIAGEWAGFHPDDVRELVLGVLGQPGGRPPPRPRIWTDLARSRFIAVEWPKIQAALDGREPEIPPPPPVKANTPVLGYVFAILLMLGGLAWALGWF